MTHRNALFWAFRKKGSKQRRSVDLAHVDTTLDADTVYKANRGRFQIYTTSPGQICG